MKNFNFLTVLLSTVVIGSSSNAILAQTNSNKVAPNECEQKSPFAGWRGAAMEKAAVDVEVPAGQNYKYYGLKTTYLYLEDGAGALDYVLYEDNNGLPGQVIKEFSGTLTRNVVMSRLGGGSAYVSEITVMFDTPLELAGGKTYWISTKRDTWAVTETVVGGEAAFLENGEWTKRSTPTEMAFELLCSSDIINYDCTTHAFTGVTPNSPFDSPSIKRGTSEAANDIFVEKDREFVMNKLKAEVIVEHQFLKPLDFDVVVYSDKNDAPDQLIASYKNITPTNLTISGIFVDAFTPMYYADITLPQPLTLSGGSNGTRYWIGLRSISDNSDNTNPGIRWMTYSYNSGINSKPAVSRDDVASATWSTFGAGYETGLFVFGECKASLATNDTKSFDFKYYPNPVKNFLDLKSEKKINSVSIYSPDAKLIVTKTIKANNDRVNLSSIANGMYIVDVKFEDGTSKNFKIVKQ
ncbi:Por secretion system C-terminal sorting domain-containing protein [Soonwooa buanensis]|uniref:Por secretion system C-terminal sorting domain-containing protein n=1 Tax=Soonwooa buanensis TaxID=619805 RepID=A0A1T5G7R7_9FLAO|nr:T9SS type A sorting domain-containing protein [Soonwooa buanensis]SKC04446.1 Por secretion system C-terminal sorting domain-containing protein [Soonwooa buanensis]